MLFCCIVNGYNIFPPGISFISALEGQEYKAERKQCKIRDWKSCPKMNVNHSCNQLGSDDVKINQRIRTNKRKCKENQERTLQHERKKMDSTNRTHDIFYLS